MSESSYFPPAESEGGWRYLATDEEVRDLAGMDPTVLGLLDREQEMLASDSSYGVVIIRKGYLVRECYSFNVSATTRFDVWSCTKSLTSTAWGMALEESRQRSSSGENEVSLDAPIYRFIPEGHPLTDPRKARISIRQVLGMTSGIGGELSAAHGCVTKTGQGPFEYALGLCANRHGVSVSQLSSDPGTRWEYSDAAFSHLSLAFSHALGREMADYLGDRLLRHIGIEAASWESQGGSGLIGPHTNAHTGFVVSARELARLGYLFLRHGEWRAEQLVAPWWVDLATHSSQDLNPAYGYGWVVNTPGTAWPYLPNDAFAANGYRSNRCYVVPSLDLVVVRVGSGPVLWDEAFLMERVAQAIVDA